MSTARAPDPEPEREMVTTRLVHAPRRLVWQSFTSAEHLGSWWGPDGFRTTTSHFELRPGGCWAHVMLGRHRLPEPDHLARGRPARAAHLPPPRRRRPHLREPHRARGARWRNAPDDAGALPHARGARAFLGALPRRPRAAKRRFGRLAALCEAQAGPASPRPSLAAQRIRTSQTPKGTTLMSRLRVNAFGISVDGYGAGPGQDLDNPMGIGGMALHEWVLGTKTFQRLHADFAESPIGDEVAREDVDDAFAARGFANVGAWILGRNMFGPMRGPWSDDTWKGWWGKNPPYHVPVFVLTHHPARPFHGGRDHLPLRYRRYPRRAASAAKEAAQARDVRLGGGPPPFASTSPRG